MYNETRGLVNSTVIRKKMKTKRDIRVGANSYIWALKGNEIYSDNRWVIITLYGTSYSRLYVNPYDHDFEIKPSYIEKAIKYARDLGWEPESNSGEIRLTYSEGKFEQIKNV